MQAHTTGASTVTDVGVHLNDGDGTYGPFAVLTFGHVQVFLETGADADKLIKAACAAKDMLHAAGQAAAMTDPLAPLRDREHYAAGAEAAEEEEPSCPSFWGTGTGETPMRCELEPYHAGMHENGGIEWYGAAGDDHADIEAVIERARGARAMTTTRDREAITPLPEPGPWTLKGTGDAGQVIVEPEVQS